MRTRLLVVGLLAAIFLIIINGIYTPAHSNLSGAPAGETGSPGDGGACNGCHSGGTHQGLASITTNIPAGGYTAGQVYIITASIIRIGHTRFGFEVSCEDTTGAHTLQGTFTVTDGTNTKLASNNTHYITHTSTGAAGTGSRSWSFNWTAPVTGKGPVVFYGAFLATNKNSSSGGDSLFLANTKVYEAICGPPATPGSISGNTPVCAGSQNTYSVVAVNGANSYNWTLPNGWTGSSTTNLINTVAGSAGGTISVTATNSCGTSGASSKPLAITAVPATPGIIGGNATVCSGSGNNIYSVTAVNGATSYNWTLPNGWTGSSTTNSITVTAGVAGGNISVTASNGCGTSSASSKTIAIATIPATPGTISGNTPVCAGSSNNYSIVAVNGASTYNWTLPSGWTGTSTTNLISAIAGATGGSITVTASNSCGTSQASSKPLAITPVPTQPGTISGPTAVCPGSAANIYRIPHYTGSGTLQWTLPNGWSGSSTTDSIIAHAGTTGGDITVLASNVCATSTPSKIAVTVSDTAHTPGLITGASLVCTNTSYKYSVVPVAGAVGYIWILPAEWTGNSSADSITVITGNTGGILKVAAYNNCDTSLFSSLSVDLKTVSPPLNIQGPVSVCPNSTNTYFVAPVANAAGYNWIVPNGWTGTSDKDSITVTVGITSETISVSAFNECNTSAQVGLQVIVSANNPSVTITSTQDTFCAGTPVTFTAHPINGGGLPKYQWFVNGASNGRFAVDFTTDALNDGDSVWVVLTSSLTCVSQSDATSEIDTVKVNALQFDSVTISTADTSICAGQNVVFTSQSVNGGDNPVYQWRINDNPVANSNSADITVTGIENGDVVTLQMTSSALCATPLNPVSNEVVIKVTAIVTPSVSISSTATGKICSSDEVTFTADAKNAGTPQYQWLKNGVEVDGETGVTYTGSEWTDGDAINVTIKPALQCVTSTLVHSDSIILGVLINASDTVTVTTNAVDSICTGQQVTFTSHVINGGIPKYQWLKNGLALVNDTLPGYQTSSLTDNDTITVQVTSSLTCLVSPVAVSDGLHFKVIPTVLPEIQIASTGAKGGCAGQQITFTSAVSNDGELPVYQWLRNGQMIDTAKKASYSTAGLADGDIITALLTSTARCAEPATVTSNADTVQIFTPVKPEIQFVNDTLGSTTPAVNYQWFLNGQKLNGVSQDMILNPTPGKYRVATQDIHGCIDTSDVLTVTPAGITDNGSNSAVSVYPNPTKGMVNIELPGNNLPVTIKVMDINGRIIKESRYNGEAKMIFDISEMQNGIYLLQLNTISGNNFRRIILEK